MAAPNSGGVLRALGRALWGVDPPRPRLRADRIIPPYVLVIVWAVIVFLMLGGAIAQLPGMGMSQDVAIALAAFQLVPLVAAPWMPLMAWRVSLLGMILAIPGAAGVDGLTWPWAITACVAYLAEILLIAWRHDRGTTGAVVGVSALALLLPAIVVLGTSADEAVLAAVVTCVVAGVGVIIRRAASPQPDAEPPGAEARPEAGPARTGAAAVPVLGPVMDALWGVSDGSRPALRLPSGRAVRILLLIAWLGFSFGMTAGAVGQMYGPTQMGFTLGMAYAMGLFQTLPLFLAPRFPLTAWRVSAVGMLLGALTGPHGPLASGPSPPAAPGHEWPWAVTACIAYLVMLFLVALRHDRRVTEGAGILTLAVALPLLLVRYGWSAPAMLLTVAFTLIVLVLGDNIRTRRAAQDRLAEQSALRRQDLARQAVLEERSRIARELHDVVAHHMSMIAIQAEAAPYKIPGLPDEALRTFTAIRGASTTALTEMRRVIGLLRDEGTAAERLPQPGMELLDDLIGGVRAAGMTVRTEVTGEPRPLPAGVDVSAYRIVQEALSNAGRHAPGATVTVNVAYEPRLLRIRVADDGAVTGIRDDTPAGGHGLVGMRERVTMLGGAFDAGPGDGGGFTVAAELPVDAAAAGSGENDGP
ncbi:MAG TPA: sensor histidine kinase [Streptosporangiaceae bacterium]|jgi:signal transduction histidine kinase